jgi:hypothetical protein
MFDETLHSLTVFFERNGGSRRRFEHDGSAILEIGQAIDQASSLESIDDCRLVLRGRLRSAMRILTLVGPFAEDGRWEGWLPPRGLFGSSSAFTGDFGAKASPIIGLWNPWCRDC